MLFKALKSRRAKLVPDARQKKLRKRERAIGVGTAYLQ